MDIAGQLFIPLCSLEEDYPRGGRFLSLLGSMLGFLVLLGVGVIRLVGLTYELLLQMSGADRSLSALWLSCVPL